MCQNVELVQKSVIGVHIAPHISQTNASIVTLHFKTKRHSE